MSTTHNGQSVTIVHPTIVLDVNTHEMLTWMMSDKIKLAIDEIRRQYASECKRLEHIRQFKTRKLKYGGMLRASGVNMRRIRKNQNANVWIQM